MLPRKADENAALQKVHGNSPRAPSWPVRCTSGHAVEPEFVAQVNHTLMLDTHPTAGISS